MSVFRDIAAAALAQIAPLKRDGTWSFQDYLDYFSFNGAQYPILNQTLTGAREEWADGFEGMVQGAYKSNGVIFACMLARLLVFSEARFQYRQINDGRPGALTGGGDLAVLSRPWPGGTTGDLLTHALQDADLAGQAFFGRRFVNPLSRVREDRIYRLRPDWTVMILGSSADPNAEPNGIDAELVALAYYDGGRFKGQTPDVFVRGEFAHYAPIPDPLGRFRGMSWLTPIIREIKADSSATSHKLKFFENGATPNMVVSIDTKDMTLDQFGELVEKLDEQHAGLANAYKTLYLANGATATVVGSDLKQLDFKMTQGAGETRIAAAAGVPPVIVGLSEGLQAATYSNYAQARRRFADGTIRPLWRNLAGSLSEIVDVPAGAELWYDDRDIPFLREDVKDEAEILSRKMLTIESGIRGGYEPESVVSAVTAGDLTLLKHTGLYSVQLQPPNTSPDSADAARSLAQMLAPYLKETLTDGTDRAS